MIYNLLENCWKSWGRFTPCWLLFHFLILFFSTFSLFATDGFTPFIVSVKGTWWWHADYLMQSRCDGQRTTHIQASALCVFTVLCPPTLNIEIKIIMPSWKISQFLKHIWRREKWGERSFAGRAIIEDEQVHALQNCSTHDRQKCAGIYKPMWQEDSTSNLFLFGFFIQTFFVLPIVSC